MVYTRHIIKNTTLCIPIEEEYNQNTTYDSYLKYIRWVLSGMGKIYIDPK